MLFAEGNVYVFARTLGTEELIVAINVGTEASRATLTPAATGLKTQPQRQLFEASEYEWTEEGQLILHLPAVDVYWVARSVCGSASCSSRSRLPLLSLLVPD
ncbi:alpha-glucosidase C-terminal domain-containing protein [Leptodesmis sp.]|uniref:alpha-glucosidase C-terminal domain-containing protein n=1 Tax=Leptodesmis sp. TaxID=3100501 RepID=UPI004053542A